MVIEINIAIVILLVAIGILLPASQLKFKPVPVDPKPVEFVAPAAPAGSFPEGWGVAMSMDPLAIVRSYNPWTMWIVALLLVVTAVTVFVAALYWPYWVALIVLCAAWWYGLESIPSQSVKITADGTMELRGYVRFAAPVGGIEKLSVKDIETVLVHKERPEAWVVFQRDKRRLGWRIYAETAAEAHAVAALLQSQLKPPATATGKPANGK